MFGIALLLVAGACSPVGGASPSATPPQQTISGSMVLTGSTSAGTIRRTDGASGCVGLGGYGDIQSGAQVTLRDGTGQVIGLTTLGSGRMTRDDALIDCRFEFAFADIPEAAFYSVEVGRRGEVRASSEDLSARGWTFAMTLGR